MIPLASGLSYVDLHFQGRPHVIATGVVHGRAGAVLIDPGPSTTLPALRSELDSAGIGPHDVTAILLTHIHLDHCGATGTLVAENPRLRVYVHERGAPHLIDPSKLMASAARLYGDAMDRLWGEVRPVNPAVIAPLVGGERIAAGGREWLVANTPGHAVHHVSYLAADAGLAFVGDTAGIRLPAGQYVLPPTPPPDINLSAWRDSLRLIQCWNPETLFLTHFGPWSPCAPHLTTFAERLDVMGRLARVSLARDGADADREAWFVDEIRQELQRHLGNSDALTYEAAGSLHLSWRGLARYWRKQPAPGR